MRLPVSRLLFAKILHVLWQGFFVFYFKSRAISAKDTFWLFSLRDFNRHILDWIVIYLCLPLFILVLKQLSFDITMPELWECITKPIHFESCKIEELTHFHNYQEYIYIYINFTVVWRIKSCHYLQVSKIMVTHTHRQINCLTPLVHNSLFHL